MKKWVLSVALATMTALAWALPSLQDVEAQVAQGRYTEAQSMMKEVVAAKPNSARAHYVYAEILAHEGNVSRAADEARLARQIDPDIRFTSPEKFRAFEASLQRTPSAPTRGSVASPATAVAPAAVAPASASSGLPSWVWLAGLAAVAFALWRGFSRSRAAATEGGGAVAVPGAFAGGPVGPGAMTPPGAVPYGASTPMQRPGGGLMGVGLAAAGGVAAGMLADQMLHRRRDGTNAFDNDSATVQPGFFDSPTGGASELADRPIDFGTGGSDWDSGSVDAGGGSDGGSWD